MTERQRRMWTGATVALTVAAVALWGPVLGRGGAMNGYPNAAPPPGALFDTATATQIPAHLTPATHISQGRNGQWYTLNVLMQYGQPVPLALAVKRVALGRTVFVAREDAGKVMEAVGDCGTQG